MFFLYLSKGYYGRVIKTFGGKPPNPHRRPSHPSPLAGYRHAAFGSGGLGLPLAPPALPYTHFKEL
ncbi:MAG: hypothetical protein QM539_10820 [Alphaproteobacteria bacterium]|nr:hypothetical protein [Alphaproteobacteria bacterium]